MPSQGNSPSLEDLMKQLATRPQDTNKTASQYYEPFTVGWIQQFTLTNNSKPKRECECTYSEKQKRTTSTSTVTAAEIKQCQL
ncbi:hypothetical protein CR513_29919, partial [Mucuna pruriens]